MITTGPADNVRYIAKTVADWLSGLQPGGNVAAALDNIVTTRRWTVTTIKTANYIALNRELVRVNPS